MQPTYLPWLGYLDLADQVDRFVFLDDVGFSKQSWQQRNRVPSRDGLLWLTVPVRTRGRLGEPIDRVEISDPAFWQKHLRTLAQVYRRAPHAPEHLGSLGAVYERGHPWRRLVDLNIALVHWLFERTGIRTPTLRASALGAGGRRGARVAELCLGVGAREYVSPPGAEAYLAEDLGAFASRGVSVRIQDFVHPVYPQGDGPFVSQASAVDLLFHRGPHSLATLREGRRAPRPLAADAGGRTAGAVA